MSFYSTEMNGIRFYKSMLIPDSVAHAFSCRTGGVSEGAFSSLNFSYKRELKADNVQENYNRFAEAMGVSPSSFALFNGDHSSRVMLADQSMRGCGIAKDNVLPVADGFVTDERGITLCSTHADCVPVFFYDKIRNVIALSHAGWRGVIAHIVIKTADMMRFSYGSDRKNLIVAVGPCICKCCFEVSRSLADEFVEEFGDVTQGRYVDLNECIRRDLLRYGVPEDHIDVAEICTSCNANDFYSHRRDHGECGTMLAAISLK